MPLARSIMRISIEPVPAVLDAFPIAPVAAYGLRRLRGAYAGPAIRLRRSSDGAEQDVGFAGQDLDAASAAAFIGAGAGFVSRWYDQSAAGRNAIQPTASQQPTYVAFGINGRPSISFPAVGGTNLSVASSGIAAMPFSVLTVYRSSEVSAASRRVIDTLQSGANWLLGPYQDRYRLFNGLFITGGVVGAGTPVLHSAIQRLSFAQHWVNGVHSGSNLGTGEFGSSFSIGSGFEPARAEVAEAMLFAADLTAELVTLETDMRAYWGLA